MRRILVCLFMLQIMLMGISAFSEEPYSSPEDNAIIEASAGMGYYNWRSTTLWGDYSTNIQPYQMKRFDIKASIFFLDCGAEYLTNRINDETGFSSDEEVQKADKSPLARQLSGFSGFKIGNYSLKTEIVYRKFQGTITSKGQDIDNWGSKGPIYFYQFSGPPVSLTPGEEAIWETVYKRYEINLADGSSSYADGSSSTDKFVNEHGIQYIEFDSPNGYSITLPEDYPTADGHDVITSLMLSKFKIYNIVFAARHRLFFIRNLYLESYVPITAGVYTIQNQYYGTSSILDKNRYYIPTNMIANSYIRESLNYVTDFFKFEVGCDLHLMCGTFHSTMNLKRDLPYLDTHDGTQKTVPAGTETDIDSTQIEYFWGIYLKASAFF